MEGEHHFHHCMLRCHCAVGAILLPNIVNWVSRRSVKHCYCDAWYDSLKKPDWLPPTKDYSGLVLHSHIVVKTVLHSGIGYASYLVWRDGGGFCGNARVPLSLYGAHLGLSYAWSPVFYGAHSMKGGLIILGLLTATAIATGHMFVEINKKAGFLLLPYAIWLGFNTAMNYVVWRDNEDKEGKE